MTGPEDGGSPLDADVLSGLEALGAALVADVVDLWTQQLPVSLDGIRAGLDAGDATAAASAAHGLRGSSANVGAARLAKTCGEFETAARGGTPLTDLEPLAARITAEVEVAKTALDARVAELLAREADG